VTLLAISFASFAKPQFWIGVGILAAVYGIFALGLQVNIGYTGIYNFGQVGFMAIGAYAMGSLVVKEHWSFWIALPAATGITVAFALLLGLTALRLRSHYFAIATISFAEIARYVIQDTGRVTGGTQGLLGFDVRWMVVARWISARLGLGPQYYLVPLLGVSWIAFLVLLLAARALVRTPWGRVLRGVREDEEAVRALGKNVFSYKVQSLAVAAVCASIAGYLLALDLSYLSPDEFTSDTTFIAYAMLVVGGLGSFVGVLLGAVFIEFVLEGTRFIHLPLSDEQVASLRFVIVGAVLIAVMAFRPQGALGKKQEMVIGD
jgi:branched-chain amino acid transport system permease protein